MLDNCPATFSRTIASDERRSQEWAVARAVEAALHAVRDAILGGELA
jgi:hypothetical protein